MFQLKSSEFLTLFYRTFEDTAGAAQAFQDMVDVQKEYDAFMASQPWQDTAVTAYLDNWSDLIKKNPAMTLAKATETARDGSCGKKAIAMRYPKSDDR